MSLQDWDDVVEEQEQEHAWKEHSSKHVLLFPDMGEAHLGNSLSIKRPRLSVKLSHESYHLSSICETLQMSFTRP